MEFEFKCDNCKKKFRMPEGPGRIMMKCPEKICSPKCASEYLVGRPIDRIIDTRE